MRRMLLPRWQCLPSSSLPGRRVCLPLLWILVVVGILPFLLSYVPSHVALAGQEQRQRYGSDSSNDDAVVLPFAVLASIKATQPQHYVMVPDQIHQKSSLRVACRVDSNTYPPDVATALHKWHGTLFTTSTSQWPLELTAVNNQTEWCLFGNDLSIANESNGGRACRRSSDIGGNYLSPDSGKVVAHVSILVHQSQRVQKRTTTFFGRIGGGGGGFRKNPNKRQASLVERLHPLLPQIPFALLAALQVYLYVVYWNGNVLASDVGKSYASIWQDGEVWRALSGSTAHFNLWHIGLNLSAFYQLSHALEHRFPPVLYLGLNLSLMALVTACWMLWQHGAHLAHTSRGGDASPSSVPTVGYSGVLFALSTIVTLERSSSCPIPFADSVCFSTFDFGGNIRLSIAPFVQLAMAQFILPRVSFSGHLAGVIVGFLYAWGWLPMALYPSIVWPLLHLVYLVNIAPHTNGSGGRRLGDSRPVLHKILALPTIRYVLLVLCSSCFLLGLTSPIVWSYALAQVFWLQSMMAPGERTLVWKRAFCVHAFVLLVTQAVTLGAWALLPGIWLTTSALFALLVQAATLWIGLWQVLDDARNTDGIFRYCLGWSLMEPMYQLQSFWKMIRHAGEIGSHSFPGEGRQLQATETELI